MSEPSELTALAVGITSRLVPKTFCTQKQPTLQRSPLPAHPAGARTRTRGLLAAWSPTHTCQALIPQWERMENNHSGLWKHICRGWSAAGPGRSAGAGRKHHCPESHPSFLTTGLFHSLPAPAFRQQMKMKLSPFWAKKVSLEMDCRFSCWFSLDELRNLLPTWICAQWEVTLLNPLALRSSTSKGSRHVRLVQSLFFLPA